MVADVTDQNVSIEEGSFGSIQDANWKI